MSSELSTMIGIVLSVFSIIVTVVLGIIAIKLSVSVKSLKNTILVQEYCKYQASTQGKSFLLNEIIFETKKHISIEMYLGINDFIDCLFLSSKKKKKIKEKVEEYKLIDDFGAASASNKNTM